LLYEFEICRLLKNSLFIFHGKKICVWNEISNEDIIYDFIKERLKLAGAIFVPIEDANVIVVINVQFHIAITEKLKQIFDDSKVVLDLFEIKFFYKKNSLIIDEFREESSKIDSEQAKNAFLEYKKTVVDRYVDTVKKKIPLFRFVEIETINRCNGSCSFCPVNKNNDKRELIFMDEELFIKIIYQLHKLHYDGHLCLFSNNEPLLDKRIIDFYRYAREQLPLSSLYMFTNGTLLTLQLFLKLICFLDELIIDNYGAVLSEPCQEIVEYIDKHKSIASKVSIIMRNPDEILTSRGGIAPNKTNIDSIKAKCALLYRQLVIRSNGAVSQCCNDAFGKVTLGNMNNDDIVDVWYGEKYMNARNNLLSGRESIDICRYCDTIDILIFN
jgi:radical SAM protein with 4Fe4S-binding SPASM domain